MRQFDRAEVVVIGGGIIAGGCCGSGVAGSGGFGQAVVELITGREPAIDIGLYRPDRFGVVDPASGTSATCTRRRVRGRAGEI